jgi:prophage antirepressor-like protein
MNEVSVYNVPAHAGSRREAERRKSLCHPRYLQYPRLFQSERELAKHTDNALKYERIRTPGGLQIVRLVPRSDVEKLLNANDGRKAFQLQRWLMKKVFPTFDADARALEEAKNIISGFVGMMHTAMAQQYFADRDTKRSKCAGTVMIFASGSGK